MGDVHQLIGLSFAGILVDFLFFGLSMVRSGSLFISIVEDSC